MAPAALSLGSAAREFNSGRPDRGVCDQQEPGPDATENNPNEAHVTKCHRNELLSQRDTKPLPMVISDER
jgi:hypothetical protein